MSEKAGGSVTQVPCAACGGQGSNRCTACGGAGHTLISKSRMRYDRSIEFYQDRVPCTGCFSSGRITCVACQGLGRVLQSGAPPSSHQGPAPGLPPGDAPAEGHREFQFRAQDFVRHPGHPEMWACWQHNPGNCLDIGVTATTSMRVELSGCQRDAWLEIRDDAGRPVPLAIFVSSRDELLGKWL